MLACSQHSASTVPTVGTLILQNHLFTCLCMCKDVSSWWESLLLFWSVLRINRMAYQLTHLCPRLGSSTMIHLSELISHLLSPK